MTAGPVPPPRRSRTLRWLLVALLLLPIIEIVVLVVVGKSIGVLWTLLLLVAMAVVGAWLARRETGRTYASLRRSLESGRMPTDEATDAILVMAGGFLLILPGFLTDLVGLLLVLPITRPAARRLLQTVVAAKVLGAAGGAGAPPRAPGRGQVIEGEIVDVSPPPGTAQPGSRPLEQ